MVALAFPKVLVHHSPNAHAMRGKRGMIQAVSNKADGTVTGWPDLIFVWPDGVAFAEVKRPGRAGATSDWQRRVLDTLTDYGFPTAVLTGPEAAREWLVEIGAPPGAAYREGRIVDEHQPDDKSLESGPAAREKNRSAGNRGLRER
jgi:hypothetical protein